MTIEEKSQSEPQDYISSSATDYICDFEKSLSLASSLSPFIHLWKDYHNTVQSPWISRRIS